MQLNANIGPFRLAVQWRIRARVFDFYIQLPYWLTRNKHYYIERLSHGVGWQWKVARFSVDYRRIQKAKFFYNGWRRQRQFTQHPTFMTTYVDKETGPWDSVE